MPEVLFAKRANRKFPNRGYNIKINEQVKKNHLPVLRDWSFKEIKQQFGPKILYYIQNLTNHDFDSLAEDLNNLSDEEKIDFKNQAYASHVEEIITDPDLCLLKYADFSKNIDLKNLPLESEKYFRLKRKYSSVIPIFISRLKMITEDHQLYSRKDLIIKNLEDVYRQS